MGENFLGTWHVSGMTQAEGEQRVVVLEECRLWFFNDAWPRLAFVTFEYAPVFVIRIFFIYIEI